MHREETDEQKINPIGPLRDVEYFPRDVCVIESSDSGSGAISFEPSNARRVIIQREDGNINDVGDEVYYVRRKNVNTTLEHDRRYAAGNTTLGAPLPEVLAAARNPDTEMVEDGSSLISTGSLSPVERSHFVV